MNTPSTISQNRTSQPVGLLAGGGRFPVLFAEKAHALHIPLVCVALKDAASPELATLSQKFHWTGIAQLGHMIRCFRRAGVKQVVMAGKVQKSTMHLRWRWLHHLPDWRMLKFWYQKSRRDNNDDSIMLGMIAEFAKDGISFASALDLCPELLVKPGILTKRAPTPKEEQDIQFGWELAKEMGRLDVGQSVAIKEKAVIAVEAIEGTDRAILRAGELCPTGGFTVVKVAKPQQDMRFDVPTVGQMTIESMHKAGARVLAIEAGQTILVDEADTIALANRHNITIIAK